jgi:hypothetical protein
LGNNVDQEGRDDLVIEVSICDFQALELFQYKNFKWPIFDNTKLTDLVAIKCIEIHKIN